MSATRGAVIDTTHPTRGRISLGYVALVALLMVMLAGVGGNLWSARRTHDCWVRDAQGRPSYFDYSRPGC